MEKRSESVEFEGVVGAGGTLAIPGECLESLGIQKGERLHVRLTHRRLNSALQKRGVTEEEIERISKLQFESRAQVVKFLLSEGAMSRKQRPFRRKSVRPGARG